MPAPPPGRPAGAMTSFVRVERPDPAAGRDRAGQVAGAWLAVAECWAHVGPVPQSAPLPERGGAVVGVSGRRVTVYRDAVPGAEEAGTRWRVVLLVLAGRPLAPPPALHVADVATPDGLTVAFDCETDQR